MQTTNLIFNKNPRNTFHFSDDISVGKHIFFPRKATTNLARSQYLPHLFRFHSPIEYWTRCYCSPPAVHTQKWVEFSLSIQFCVVIVHVLLPILKRWFFSAHSRLHSGCMSRAGGPHSIPSRSTCNGSFDDLFSINLKLCLIAPLTLVASIARCRRCCCFVCAQKRKNYFRNFT